MIENKCQKKLQKSGRPNNREFFPGDPLDAQLVSRVSVLCFTRLARRGQVPLFNRIVWIVLDSVGIGELPDAADYSDVGRNTLGHISESRPLNLPTLVSLGLANIASLKNLSPAAAPLAAHGKGTT